MHPLIQPVIHPWLSIKHIKTVDAAWGENARDGGWQEGVMGVEEHPAGSGTGQLTARLTSATQES